MKRVFFNPLEKGYFAHQEEMEKKILEVLRSGWYILGREVSAFEKNFANYMGSQYAVGCDNGLNAIVLALRTLNIGPGDEVLIQSNAYIACVLAITMVGATPVFVDVELDYRITSDALKVKITPMTKAIIVVHLYGHANDMSSIMDFAKQNNLYVVEDCAQSHGAEWDYKKTGTFGDIGCFSFYPSKNLGGYGDGGMIITNNMEYERKLKILRNYGSEKRYENITTGYNSRLDEIQAALLNIKLNYLDSMNDSRIRIANRYSTEISNRKITNKNKVLSGYESVYHIYPIEVEDRDALIKYLDSKGIQTIIHYPIPPHLSQAYAYLELKKGSFPICELISKHIVSIPIYSEMDDSEVSYVIQALNQYS